VSVLNFFIKDKIRKYKKYNYYIYLYYLINLRFLTLNSFLPLGIGDWGLGIGDWGLGIGDWAQSPIPNPQSPIPMIILTKKMILYKFENKNILFL